MAGLVPKPSWVARARRSFEAYKEGMEATKGACPIGKLIHSNDVDNSEIGHAAGYHATPYDRVVDQVAQGHFDNRGQDIYFGDKETAAHFGGRDEDKPVILFVAGDKKTRVYENEAFGTQAFSRGKDQKVYILAVNEINPDWIDEQENPHKRMGFFQRIFHSSGKAIEAFDEVKS